MKFNKLIPELSVTNINDSIDFYLKLGFKIMYERKENKFCFIELDGNQIMLEEVNENWNVGELVRPYGRGINISMTVKDVEELFQNVKNMNIKVFKEIKVNSYRVGNKVYEDKEFLLQDPDGYLLRFNN